MNGFRATLEDGSKITLRDTTEVWSSDVPAWRIFRTKRGYVHMTTRYFLDGKEVDHDVILTTSTTFFAKPNHHRNRVKFTYHARMVTLEEALRLTVEALVPEELSGHILKRLAAGKNGGAK